MQFKNKQFEVKRSILGVLDATRSASLRDEENIIPACDVLDPLSAPDIVALRKELRRRYHSKEFKYLCAACGKPLFVRKSKNRSYGHSGRAYHFKHHKGDAKNCEWGSDEGQKLDEIDKSKFQGASEGARHKKLKRLLADMLCVDPDFEMVKVERAVKGTYQNKPKWRKPDVSSKTLGRLIAFDIQLATTQLPVIVAREDFYELGKHGYMWIVDANDIDRLSKQAFQDIYWANHGQIFGLDEIACEHSEVTERAHFWCLSVAPRLLDGTVGVVWEKRLVSASEIDWLSVKGRPCIPEYSFEARIREGDFAQLQHARKALLNAVRTTNYPNCPAARDAWDMLAEKLDLPMSKEAQEYRLFKALGVLATAASGQKRDSSAYKPENLTAVFDAFLNSTATRGWTIALERVAEAYENKHLIADAPRKRKILKNKSEQHRNMEEVFLPALKIFFPRYAFSKITSPPSDYVIV